MDIDLDVLAVDDFDSRNATLHLEDDSFAAVDHNRLELGRNFEVSLLAVFEEDPGHHFDFVCSQFDGLVFIVHDSAHLSSDFFLRLFFDRFFWFLCGLII